MFERERAPTSTIVGQQLSIGGAFLAFSGEDPTDVDGMCVETPGERISNSNVTPTMRAPSPAAKATARSTLSVAVAVG
jgi:hypothetical protein